MRRFVVLVASVAAVVSLVVLPVGLEAQCGVANTVVTTSTGYVTVVKTLSAIYLCQLMMPTNAVNCFPNNTATPVPASYLSAAAATAMVSPFCNWMCNCGPVSINSSDGLPVELMAFSVE